MVKFLGGLKWEFLQNLPMIIGFLIATRIRTESLVLAYLIFAIGVVIGIVIMHYTEPFLHKRKYPTTLFGDILNLVLFLLLGSPFLFYFSIENRWINWRTDLIIGMVLGVILTIGQSLAWKGAKSRMMVHGLAMVVSFPLILIGMRWALKIESWGGMLRWGVLVVLLASALITGIDYQEIYRC